MHMLTNMTLWQTVENSSSVPQVNQTDKYWLGQKCWLKSSSNSSTLDSLGRAKYYGHSQNSLLTFTFDHWPVIKVRIVALVNGFVLWQEEKGRSSQDGNLQQNLFWQRPYCKESVSNHQKSEYANILIYLTNGQWPFWKDISYCAQQTQVTFLVNVFLALPIVSTLIAQY